jgi:hypothetical protein
MGKPSDTDKSSPRAVTSEQEKSLAVLMTPERPVRSRVLAMRRVTDSMRALKIASWTAVGCSVMRG